MRNVRHRLLLLLGLSVVLFSSCKSNDSAEATASASPEPQPAPTVTVTATATPDLTTPTPSDELELRVRTQFPDTSAVTFEVQVNGQMVGSYNAEAEAELGSYLRAGSNQVTVTWTADPAMAITTTAKLFLEQRRGFTEDWSTLLSRQIGKDTPAGSAEVTVTDGESQNTSPDELQTTPTPGPQTSDSALSEVFTAKVDNNSLLPTEFNLTLNGKQVGSFAGDADQNISDSVVKGKNTGTLTYKVQATGRINTAAQSSFALGVQRKGKWSTLLSQDVSSRNPEGSRDFEFNAE